MRPEGNGGGHCPPAPSKKNGQTNDKEEKVLENSAWKKQSFLGEMGYSTKEPDSYRHRILTQACKDYGKQRIVDHISFLINLRLAQKNGAVKFSTAINKWKADIVFVRKL